MSLDIEQPLPSIIMKEEGEGGGGGESNSSQTLIMNTTTNNNNDDQQHYMNDEGNCSYADDTSNPNTLVVNEENEHYFDKGGGCWSRFCGTRALSSSRTIRSSSKGSVSFWLFAIVTVLVIAGGTLTAVIMLVSSNRSTTTNINEITDGGSGMSSDTSSKPQRSDIYYQERYEAFQTIVVGSISLSSSSSLSSMPNTPQYKAFHWMVYDDTTIGHEPFLSSSASSSLTSSYSIQRQQQFFIQRYTIMILFYTCGGEEWQLGNGDGSSLDKLGHVETCDWGSSISNDEYDDDDLIVCDTDTKEIHTLKFDQKRLSGSLPDELRTLTSLITFDVSYNFLKGTIPSNLFENMKQLQILRLNNNEFIGPLPTLIGQQQLGSSKLQELRLGYNYFTGTVPMEYESLIALQHFHVKELTFLNGPFFHIFGSTNQWTQLQSLTVDGCNSLTGTIPSQVVSSWSDSMMDLELGSHIFSGTFPSEIGTLTKLTNFNSIGNHMFGPFPNITTLTALKYLTIQGSNITGTIPSSIGTLQDLNEFSVRFTGISGTIPTEMGLCTDLELFTITNTNITGTIPIEITNNVPSLSLIALQDNIGLAGSSIPDTLCPYIESGLLHLSISCDIKCACCIDQCTTTTATGEV